MKKEKVIRLTEAEFNNVISNTIKEAIDKQIILKESELLKENWLDQQVIELGDYVLRTMPSFFETVMHFKSGWENETLQQVQQNPDDLNKAKEVVGTILSVPIGVLGFFGLGGAVSFLSKYKNNIEKIKNAFFMRKAKEI